VATSLLEPREFHAAGCNPLRRGMRAGVIRRLSAELMNLVVVLWRQ
jgi:hypothetical protein